jgi:outer membrane lipoprotein-sorting protein
MSPHNVTNEQLVRFVLGELPSDEVCETELHIRQCESCKEAVGRFGRLLDCAGRMAAVPVDEHTIESANREVLLAAKTHSNDQRRRRVQSRAALFGRTIMSNRTMRLAVAVVVALAVILGLSLFTGDGAGKAYAKVVDQLHRAHTLTYSLVTRTGVESMPTVRLDIAYKDPRYLRTATADGFITVAEATKTGIKGISLVPPTKSYVVFEVTNVPDDPAKDPWAAVERLRALPARASKVLGRREIDGRMLDGFNVHEDDATTTVWIDPKTGQLVRAELEFASAPGMNMILSDFQFDVLLDDSFFSLQPPEGYIPVPVSADVSQVAERDFIEFLRLWSNWTVDATFPPTVNGPDIAKIAVQMAQEGKFVGPYAPAYGVDRTPQVMYRGILFLSPLPTGSWRYAGQNVRFGDPAVPIFWYQPAGSPACRVIYADLHVANVAPESLPK